MYRHIFKKILWDFLNHENSITKIYDLYSKIIGELEDHGIKVKNSRRKYVL